MAKDIFENLVTDITQQVLEAVQQQVQPAIATAIDAKLTAVIDSGYITRAVEERINKAVMDYTPDMSAIDQNLQSLMSNWTEQINTTVRNLTNQAIHEKLSGVDINKSITDEVKRVLDPEKKQYPFPTASINGAALDVSSLVITGDNIQGGVIKNFGSTGIDDQATTCKVTILDQGTVFENTLYAPKIEVKGGAIIDGDLEILGNIVDNPAYRQLVSDVAADTQTAITSDVLAQHQEILVERLRTEGIDLSKILINGRLVVDGDRLLSVVNSQLRTVGTLQDLQTSGDTFLSDTVFIANKRMGINTMDPKNALSIWDEEIEIGFGKNQKGIGRIAVERDNKLILGANNHDNITLNIDGSTKIPVLQLNNMSFTSAATPPSYDAAKGTVVFNENPSLGGPLGWVSLGDARWANFGIID